MPAADKEESRYQILIVVVVVVAAAGFIGYLLYPRFDLPAVEGAGLLVLSSGGGRGVRHRG